VGKYLDLQRIDRRLDQLSRHLVRSYDPELDDELTDLTCEFLEALGQIAWLGYLIESSAGVSVFSGRERVNAFTSAANHRPPRI
jgi:hypothetical protein